MLCRIQVTQKEVNAPDSSGDQPQPDTETGQEPRKTTPGDSNWWTQESAKPVCSELQPATRRENRAHQEREDGSPLENRLP